MMVPVNNKPTTIIILRPVELSLFGSYPQFGHFVASVEISDAHFPQVPDSLIYELLLN